MLTKMRPTPSPKVTLRTCAHCQGTANQGSIVEYEKVDADGQLVTEPTHVWCVALCHLEGERHQAPEMALVQ